MSTRPDSNVPVEQRLRHLVEVMEKENLDCSIITEPKNVYYFTGFSPQSILSLVYSFSPPTYLLVFRDAKQVLLIPQKDSRSAKEVFEEDVVTYTNYDLKLHMIAYPDFVAKTLKNLIVGRDIPVGKVGVESWHIPHILLKVFNQSEFYDLSRSILSWRSVKDQYEVRAIRRSCELNDFAYSIAKPVSIEGRSEIEVYSIVQEELTNKVGSYQFFAGDVASGERSLEMGGSPTARRLNNGETFILDLWLTWKGYWSDTCRTFVVGGRPKANQKHIHELLQRAMAAGEEKLRPGSNGREVYAAVFDVISAAGLATRFPHHAGHGIGLDDQEAPFFIPASNDVLVEGMVCTLEPGVYVPGVGGFRIEHNYLITESGPERLTNYPLDL